MNKELIKQDINFLEYPLWFQNKDAAHKAEGFIWQDREGFIYRAGYKPPVQIDFIFLFALLLHSQQQNWQEEIVLTRYQLLKDCGLEDNRNTYWYQRLEESLERWKMVGIKFQGTFYDGKSYLTMNFGIIDSWEISKETKKLKVRFSPYWLLCIKNSNYFKMLDFGQVKALHSPLATRLYEILLKNFQGREKWEINAVKLAEKIPMKEQYPADIIPKIKTAVNRINEKTELRIEMEVRRPERGKAIFVFRKTAAKETEQEEGPVVWDVAEEQRGELEGLLGLVPSEHRQKKTVLEIVSRFLRKKGEEYTRENILYTNEHEPTNYRAYLAQSLRQNFASYQEASGVAQPSVAFPEACIRAERREVSEEEVEAEFNKRLKEMEPVVLECYLREARVELAKERFEEEPTIHPDKILHRDAQERLFQRLRYEARCSLSTPTR